MKVSAFRTKSRGLVTYGIRIGVGNRAIYFAHRPQQIEVELDGRLHIFKMTTAFWTVPVIKDVHDAPIRHWLAKYQTTNWIGNYPPRFELHVLGRDRFSLGRPDPLVHAAEVVAPASLPAA